MGTQNGGDFLLATGATTGATSQAQTFTNGIVTGHIRPASDSTTAIRFYKADGVTTLATLDSTNDLWGFGTTPTTSAKFNMLFTTPSDPPASRSTIWGRLTPTITTTNNQVYNAILGETNYSNNFALTRDTLASAYAGSALGGILCQTVNTSTATVTSQSGFSVQNFIRGSGGSPSVVTSAFGGVIQPAFQDSGVGATVGSVYGLYLKDASGAAMTVTTQYGLYVAGIVG